MPSHQTLIEAGFLEYVASRRKQGPDGPLFSGLSSKHNVTGGLSKWWHRLVTGLFGEPSTVGATGAWGLNGLRHSWRLAAQSTGLSDSITKRIGGWSDGSAFEGCGKAGSVLIPKEKIDLIKFPEVDWSALRPAAED